MKTLTTLLFTLLFFGLSFAQDNIEEYVLAGEKLDSAENYSDAINQYRKAIKIDENSTLALTKLAFAYYNNEQYAKAIEQGKKALSLKSTHLPEAYAVVGRSYTNAGYYSSANKIFKKAIKKTKGNYLVYYNYSLALLKQNNILAAEENMAKCAYANPEFVEAHYQLTLINQELGNRIKATLAGQYFLLKEPNSERSKKVFRIVSNYLGANIVSKENDDNTITINLGPNGFDSEFGFIEIMFALNAAKIFTVEGLQEELEREEKLKEEIENSENEDLPPPVKLENEEEEIDSEEMEKEEVEETPLTKEEAFVEKNRKLFKLLSLDDKKNDNVWWQLYAPFFNDLVQTDNYEAYCMYISQSSNAAAADWLLANKEQNDALNTWVSDNQ